MRAFRAVRAAVAGALAPLLVPLFVLLVILLPACTTLPAGSFDRTLAGHTIEGRMSVRYRDLATGKDDASSGRFVWTSDAGALELSLLDPLGQTVALIRSDARRSSIVFRDGRRVDGATPEELTEQTLGWTVPLRGLGDWLEGRTAKDRPATPLDDGRVRQDGWTLRFQRDAGAAPDAPPRRIDLAYPGPPAAIELRLVVDQRTATPTP